MADVELSNVSFSYPVFQITGRSLKVSLFNQMAGGKLSKQPGMVMVEAVRDVSFTLKAGDRLGLIGHNGAGKSTLLQLIAGLAHPRKGKLTTRGRVVPLINRSLGVNQELSGLANIELPLRLLGATSREVAAAKRDIPEFTGLGPFIHLPVRTYSDGMRARLSFALCTAIDADILVLDEWLGAGDADFYARAQERLTSYISRTKVLVLATHSTELMQNICNVVVWMHQGQMVMMGPPEDVIPTYLRAVEQEQAVRQAAE